MSQSQVWLNFEDKTSVEMLMFRDCEVDAMLGLYFENEMERTFNFRVLCAFGNFLYTLSFKPIFQMGVIGTWAMSCQKIPCGDVTSYK